MTDDAKKSARYREGMAIRRKVLGEAYVDNKQKHRTALDAPFQELVTEAAWGHVWARPQLSLRERSMITVALLAALGHDEELALHVRATANSGASRDDIREAMLHVAIYAGIPAANHAIGIVRKTFEAMDAPPDDRGSDG